MAKADWEDRTLSVPEVLGSFWRALIPVTALTLGIHLALWGWPAGSSGDWVAAGLWMLGWYLVAVVVHELLHVLPMLAAGVRLRELSFGIRWSEGVVFVHGARAVSARAYRIILALPGVVLGVMPLAFGLATGNAFVTVFSYLMLVSAVGDWAVWRLIRDLDPEEQVLDHHTAIGCSVLRSGKPA
jgi:putative zincin peptidase